MTLGEKMANAGLNTLMGMGVVFLVLILISFIIYLLKFVNVADRKSAGKKANQDKPVEVKTQEAVAVEEELVDDTELVAVIAAAIATYEGTSTDGFVVRSIRKVNNKWKRG